jgi:hypothetical protein
MEVLGHSAIGVTMNTYTHVLALLRQDAADAIDKASGPELRVPLLSRSAPMSVSVSLKLPPE